MDKDSKPEAMIPVALMTSWRRAATSKGWVPPRHSDSNLTTLGPQRVNTGRGIFCDNIIVRRTLRCCVDWNLIRVSYYGHADDKCFHLADLICLTSASMIPGRVHPSSGPKK